MIIKEGSKLFDESKNNYILGSEIGQGGFGIVYKAFREGDGRTFAIKTMLSSFGTTQDYESFKNEVKTALTVSSDNVIKYEYVHDGNTFNDLPPYIIMEYADQGTLNDLVKEHKSKNEFFSNSELKKMFSQLSAGMLDINRVLVHRDIKLDNILISNGILKISDFGLSKFVNDSTRTMTFKGYGSDLYVAPEAWKNEKNTIKMDIYSMGIVFYQLAALSYPYNIENSSDIREAHLYQNAQNPIEINKNLSPILGSLIINMLEKPISKRLANWEDVIKCINSVESTNSNISELVNRAVANRLNKDISKQIQETEKDKRKRNINDFCKMIESQIESTIYLPLNQFVDQFNTKYSGNKIQIYQHTQTTHNILGEEFHIQIELPSENNITIEIQTVLEENYVREIPRLQPYNNYSFHDYSSKHEHYIPECNGRNIMAWGRIVDSEEKGFNILLLENKNDMYGEWFLLFNRNSALSREKRAEPFGFELNELPEQIREIGMMSEYSSVLTSFDINKIYEYLLAKI